jgi:putative ABC transport system permease protein
VESVAHADRRRVAAFEVRVDPALELLRIASRNLVRHRGRTAMTLAAIAFGVAALILSGGFIEDVLLQLREATIKSRLGHIEVFREGYAAEGRRDPFRYVIEDTSQVTAAAKREPQIAEVFARLHFQGLLNNGRSDLPIFGEGVDGGLDSGFDGYVRLIAGRALARGDTSSALVGEGVAKSMKLVPGDFVTLVANVHGGATNTVELRVAGVFRTFSSDFDNRAVRVPLAAARDLLTVEGAHSIVISLGRTEDTDSVASSLAARLRPLGYEVKAWHELDDFYPKTMALYRRQFGILQLIILAIVMMSVANSVNMTAFERMAEYGTLRAMGTGTGGIARMIVVENLLLGVLGAAFGVVAAAMLGSALSWIGIPMPPPPNANSGYLARIQLVPWIIGASALIGIVATVASSMIAVFRITRTPIAEALRQST